MRSSQWGMVKRLIASLVLSLVLLGCAELAVKDDSALEEESSELTPEELMFQQRQKMQQQMMQQGRPIRIGPGQRF